MTREEFSKDYATIIPIEVVWGEMDAAQHVNNVAYFRYLETARVHYLWDINFIIDTYAGKLGPILAYIDCKYKAPLTFPDTVLVGVKINMKSFDEYSFIMEQEIYSTKLKRIVAESKSKIVVYDYSKLKKTAIPEDVKKAIEDHENK